MNGFEFQYLFFQRQLKEIFDITLKTPHTKKYNTGTKYIPANMLMMYKLYRTKEIQKYDIVQFNNTENFLFFEKSLSQISIAESHGFDFGVNYDRYLEDEKNPVLKCIGWITDKVIGWKIRKKIQDFDLYYCSTPDMLDPLKKIRPDVKWLPNPINTELFTPEGKIIKLEGNPACFFPTRLHGDKKPEYAIRIFQDYIKPKYPEATLHLLNQGIDVERYKKELSDEQTYFWHDFMDKETLAAKIRGSDLCFGDFSIGGLSLMPMQIMACRKPIVTYDMHELIKVERDDLLDLTKNILENPKFRSTYIERNYQYILDMHSEASIAKMHLKNILPIAIKKNPDLAGIIEKFLSKNAS
ncbi:MAG: hypothetical protein HHAS10_02340 [Candidatus Altimarinota bacterium]